MDILIEVSQDDLSNIQNIFVSIEEILILPSRSAVLLENQTT